MSATMEPRIQYAQTSDGVSIAFRTIGEGKPLIGVPTGPWGMAMESRNPGYRRWHERLARKRMVVLYDNRGTGLSGSEEDWSFESQTLDLDAVVNHLGVDGFALVAPSLGGPAAIAYAAGHPERVTHLLLWCSWARTTDALGSPQAQAILALIDKDWEVFTETAAHVIFGWSSGSEAHEAAVAFRESMPKEMMRAYLEALFEFDVTDLLSQLRSPTLVVHCRQSQFPGPDVAQGLASRIPNARLALLEGPAVPWLGDMDANARAMEEFVGGVEPSHAVPIQPSHSMASPAESIEPHHGMAVILFADIADSTALTEQMGDAAFREKARELDGSLRAAIRERGGTPIEGKLLGDGVLAMFMSAQQAIEAAFGCAAPGDSAGLRLHLGVHAGDVIREEDPDGRANVYGGTVNTAARIAAASAPGEVLVSDTVRALARTSAGVSFEDRGDRKLKGMSDAIRLFAVRPTGAREIRRPSEAVREAPPASGLTEPPIQYTKTPDGVNIAFNVIGEGSPVVYVPQYPWSNIQTEWQVTSLRQWWERMARTMQVIRYDARGTGLSDRDVTAPSLDDHLRDLQAVVHELALGRFALLGATSAGPVAIAYAGRHQDLVSHLVLWCTSSRGADIHPSGSEALDQMATKDWHFFTQTIAHSAFSWLHAEEAQQMAAFLRTCITPEALVASMLLFREQDATPYLSHVSARTLVMTRRDVPWLGVDVARGLASRIPGARLVVVEGSSIAPASAEGDVLEVVREFLSEEGEVPASRTAVDRQVSLTARETEVLSLLAGGCSGREIAAQLTVSLSTVQRHIANIYAKIGARGRVEAAAYAIGHGLVRPRDA